MTAQAEQTPGHRRHNGRPAPTLSDIGGQGSSATPQPSSAGKVGSKIDITA